jgi:YVTN family beta-propeller protein
VSTVEIGNSSVSTATVKASDPQDVVVSPDGKRAYVTDGVTSVWVVDTESNSVVAVVPAGAGPGKLAISPDGKSVYVATIFSSGPSCVASVVVIDTTTDTVTSTIPVGKGPGTTRLSGITVTPDSKRVYVAVTPGSDVLAIDTASYRIADTIAATNSGNSDISISPDGKRVYAAGWVRGVYQNTIFVDVIDTQTDSQSAAILLDTSETPVSIVVTPDGSQAFVTGDIGDIWVVDTVQNALMAKITVSPGNPLNAIAITPDGARMYVGCGNTNTIYVIDTGGSGIVDAIPSDYPGGLTIHSAT